MSDKKPNVFPTKEEMEAANATGEMINTQFQNDHNINGYPVNTVHSIEEAAAEQMRLKTEQQIAERTRLLQEQIDRAAALDLEREKVLSQKGPIYSNVEVSTPVLPPIPPTPPTSPSGWGNPAPNHNNNKYEHISQPQTNASFDVIPLPSEGKLYRNKKKAIKVAFLNASDENILTNPNLVNSGDFLEILFNRKVLEPELRYKDLHVGDRNAIMIWLRSTGYGHEYPITLIDPETLNEFEYMVDLTALPTKKLGAEPDRDGYFDLELPVSRAHIKFKLLTVGDVDDIETHNEAIIKEHGPEYADPITYSLEKMVMEVNGERDRDIIRDFVQTMRVGDSGKLREYVNEIESGVEMRITTGTPGGGSIDTFLPLNRTFFWPNLRV